jgi:hypothetical protein
LCTLYSSSQESSAPGLPPPPPPPPSKKTRKTLYVTLGIIAVAAVASAFGFVYFIPPSYRVNITSNPSGSGFITVDGNPVTTPYAALWQSGSAHNVSANSRASGKSGLEYAYSSWSDGGAPSHIIAINSSANYSATFLTLIPLTYDYTPGEEMTYNMTDNITNLAAYPGSQNVSETGTMALDVISFDGENYTINETYAFQILNSKYAAYITYAINKTGYITPINSTAEAQALFSWFSNFQSIFQKNETTAGETWQIPLNTLSQNNSNVTFNGILTETFGDVQNVTVPAGTYRVFSVVFSGTNLTMITHLSSPINESVSENLTVIGQMHLEYGTCRLIQNNLQMSISYSLGTQTSYELLSEQVELVKHITP